MKSITRLEEVKLGLGGYSNARKGEEDWEAIWVSKEGSKERKNRYASISKACKSCGTERKAFISNTNSIKVTKSGVGQLYVHMVLSLNAYTLYIFILFYPLTQWFQIDSK